MLINNIIFFLLFKQDINGNLYIEINSASIFNLLLNIGVSLIIGIGITLFLRKKIRVFPIFIFFFVLTVILSLIDLFEMDAIRSFVLIISIILALAYIVSYEKEFKNIFSAPHPKHSNLINNHLDRTQMIKIINELVFSLSSSKTGALITFEKNDNLSEFIKNGSMVNAPISVNLLNTIFYVGTPLHDGAVIIKDNTIIAAAVFYEPTTKPLSGKFGARHRAALGISELTDSITIIVSEETGRVSLAYKGSLIPLNRENFVITFVEYLDK